jgi:hypothetical protein
MYELRRSFVLEPILIGENPCFVDVDLPNLRKEETVLRHMQKNTEATRIERKWGIWKSVPIGICPDPSCHSV